MLLRFRGGSALSPLSPFRLEKLTASLATATAATAQVSHIYAEYWYFCAVAGNLRQGEIAILEDLLEARKDDPPGEASNQRIKYSTYAANGELSGELRENFRGELPEKLLLVLPRPGTISPWSTKATDIAHHCGLKAVERLERGTAFYVQTGNEPFLELPSASKGAL